MSAQQQPKFCLSRAEGEGAFILKAGDSVYQPLRHVHDFIGYREDIEIFELASPADHSSIDV